MVNAAELLAAAVRDGRLERSREVTRQARPDAARSYLSDGTGLAWHVPSALLSHGTFVLDAEIPRPVRSTLVRRYGVDDPDTFAERWTRAEALAKLADLPIITWLSRHGLTVPEHVGALRDVGETDWSTERFGDVIVTFAVTAHAQRADTSEERSPAVGGTV